MKKKKAKTQKTVRCPYCGATAEIRSSKGIISDKYKEVRLYVCRNYPTCDSYVRVQEGTNLPLGTLANKKLRQLRIEAHKYFNQLYEKGIMTKDEAYTELRECMTIGNAGHIAALGEYGCNQVIDYCRKRLGF